MLYTKIDSEKYRAEVIKKLSNFCEKSPVLLSFVTSDAGIILVHTNTSKQYTFKWDYLLPPKAFIHSIKDILVANHYPRMLQIIQEEISLTPEEQAKLLEEGVEAENLPLTKTVTTKRYWRIDRVIVWRDIFIIVDEETQEQFRYKMHKSCVFYLKAYRSGKYTLETAAETFFKNSSLLNKIDPIA